MTFYGRFITVVIIVLIIANVYNCLKRCIQNHTIRREQRHERQRMASSQGASNENGNGNGNNNNQNNTDPEIGLQGSRSIQDQEDRRLIILTSIVHKKVIAESDDKEITLPHTKELSRRSLVKEGKGDDDEIDIDAKGDHSDDASIDIENQDKEQDEDDNAKKSDITISTSCSSTKSKSKALDTSTLVSESLSMNTSTKSLDLDEDVSIHYTPESLYSPRTCPICLDDYEAGDDICWSSNKKCHHAFHLDCMSAWLMNNDDCPLCREDYLNSTAEADA
jgi:hypothetical protein